MLGWLVHGDAGEPLEPGGKTVAWMTGPYIIQVPGYDRDHGHSPVRHQNRV